MPTFESVAAGKSLFYTREIELLGDVKCKVAYGVLSGMEEAAALAAARAYAVGNGIPEPKDGDEIYELAKLANRIQSSFVDPDDHSKPFFTSAAQVLTDRRIGKDRIVYLNELQELWQDECCPSRLKMGDAEFDKAVREIAGSEAPDFFADLRPGLRWIFARTTAVLLLEFLRLKSSSGLSSVVENVKQEMQLRSEPK